MKMRMQEKICHHHLKSVYSHVHIPPITEIQSFLLKRQSQIQEEQWNLS